MPEVGDKWGSSRDPIIPGENWEKKAKDSAKEEKKKREIYEKKNEKKSFGSIGKRYENKVDELSSSDEGFKKTVGWLLKVGVPITVICGGLTELVLILSKRFGGVLEKPEKMFGFTTTEEAQNYHLDNVKFDLSQSGMEAIHIGGLDGDTHIDSSEVINFTARNGGPSWMLNTVDLGLKPAISEKVFGEITSQLKLDSMGQAELRQIWATYLSNPQEFNNNTFINFLQAHGASQSTVSFYQCSLDVFTNDNDKNTWEDRVDGVKTCAIEAKSSIQTESRRDEQPTVGLIENKENGFSEAAYFKDLAERVNIETGGAVGAILGPLETFSNMQIDTTDMQAMVAVDMAEYYVNSIPKPQLTSGGLPLILTGLLLLRVGPSWPKEVISQVSKRAENVYYWLKLGQPERAMRDLAVLGKQAWDKVVNKKV